VKRIGLDGGGSGLSDNVALNRQQPECGQGREYDHADADLLVLHRQGMSELVYGVQDKEGGGTTDKGSLRETGEGLGFAVTEAVFLIGRLQGIVHGKQVDPGRERIHGGIDQGGRDADGIGKEPSAQFGNDQDNSRRDRRNRCQAKQAFGSHSVYLIAKSPLPGTPGSRLSHSSTNAMFGGDLEEKSRRIRQYFDFFEATIGLTVTLL